MTDRAATDRRSALRQLLARAVVAADELSGKPQLRLRDLESLPEETLRDLVPRLDPGLLIFVDNGAVRAQWHPSEPPVELLPPCSEDLPAFNRFDGRRSLWEAAQDLARELSWSDEDAWLRVRGLFLHLVHLGVCSPRGPLP